MASTAPINCGNLFSVSPQLNWQEQLTVATVATSHQGVNFRSGYVGEDKDTIDFTEKWDHPAMVIKCWTNDNKTVLKAVAIFSKYRVPFKLEIECYPPADPIINQKYLGVLNGSGGIERAYTLLQVNPTEFPMIPAEQIRKILGVLRVQPFKNGDLDFRSEIIDRKENTHARGSY